MSSNDGLVLVGVAQSQVELSIWRDALAQEGVRVVIKAADPLATFGVPPVTGFRVYVQPDDEKRARWVLGEPRQVRAADRPDEARPLKPPLEDSAVPE